jgi:23S rRNA pseudouridine2605 synthase
MKLLLFLSHSGLLSRRKAFEAIQSGDVEVNGELVKEPSFLIDPALDRVVYQKKRVTIRKIDYILLHKPKGFVTSKQSQFGQKTVMELLPGELRHVSPVGRLDKDTDGVLLLTNDGELAHALTHPKFVIDKVYIAQVKGCLSQGAAEQLRRGVMIEGERTAPALISVLRADQGGSRVKITIHEGRKRQVRLMMAAVGNPVVDLQRVRQGSLTVNDLKPGAWRRLTAEEIKKMKELLGTS